MSEKFDIYEAVTNRIIDQLNAGIIPWHCPWTGVSDGAIKHRDGRAYSLLNQLLLGEEGEYMSFLECKKAGGTIRKGAKSRMVVFFKTQYAAKQDENGNIVLDDKGNIVVKAYPVLRYSSVFHIRDCEGVAPKWDDEKKLVDIEPVEHAENIISDYLKRSGVTLRNEKQNRAYYTPDMDRVTLPLRKQFTDIGEYYSTAFHELTHSTGHPKRLNRIEIGVGSHFGDEPYAREELVAELGAAAILHEIGIETGNTFKNNAGYVQGWLKALKNDKRMIVSAASRADKAVRLILNMQDAKDESEAA